MKIHNFEDSLKFGEIGEKIVMDYLSAKDVYLDILDVRGNAKYQDTDVDIILEHKNGKKYLAEIKTDSYKSGNIFYETISAEEVSSKGCMEKTEADFLFYYFIKSELLYIINMPKYREWFNNNKLYFDKQGYKKSLFNKRYNGTTYSTIGYAIPLILINDKQWINIIELNSNNKEV